MKKLLAVMVLLHTLFLFCGCFPQNPMDQIRAYPIGYEVYAKEFTGTFQMTDEKNGSFTLHTPNDLKGISYILENGKGFVCCNDLKLPLDPSDFPCKGELFAAFTVHPREELVEKEEGEKWKVTVVTEEKNYVFCFEKGEGRIQLKIEGEEQKIYELEKKEKAQNF